MNTKTIQYLSLRRKKLKLALEQIRYRDKAKEETKNLIKDKIKAKLEEIDGMMERLRTHTIDEMITIATEDYKGRKNKKDAEVRKASTVK